MKQVVTTGHSGTIVEPMRPKVNEGHVAGEKKLKTELTTLAEIIMLTELTTLVELKMLAGLITGPELTRSEPRS